MILFHSSYCEELPGDWPTGSSPRAHEQEAGASGGKCAEAAQAPVPSAGHPEPGAEPAALPDRIPLRALCTSAEVNSFKPFSTLGVR